MPKKRNSGNDTKDIVVEVKTALVDTIVREWLKTPIKEWGNRTPLQIIKAGDGSKLLDAIKNASKPIPEETETEPMNIDVEQEETQYSKFI